MDHGCTGVAICTRCAETKDRVAINAALVHVAIRTNCAERRSKPLKYISIEVLIFSVAGPQYFKYNGAWLNAIRRRLENRE